MIILCLATLLQLLCCHNLYEVDSPEYADPANRNAEPLSNPSHSTEQPRVSISGKICFSIDVFLERFVGQRELIKHGFLERRLFGLEMAPHLARTNFDHRGADFLKLGFVLQSF